MKAPQFLSKVRLNSSIKKIAILGLTVIVLVSVIISAIALKNRNLDSRSGAYSGVLSRYSTGYLTNIPELEERKRLADKGVEPYKSSVAELIKYANTLLSKSPSPTEVIDIPGTTGAFVDDTANAYGLALAYGVTKDARYSRQSREYIMAWVNKAHKTKNTCTDSGACQTSLIIGRVAPGFVFAADLIKSTSAYSAQDDAAFKLWLRDVILPTASNRDNNWGDFGMFMKFMVSDYIKDEQHFNEAVAKYKSLMDLVKQDGSIPEETRRGSSGMNYTQEALDARLAIAIVAERRNLNLYSYKGKNGASLKTSVDFLAKYMLVPKNWPFDPRNSPSIHPMWELAYSIWREKSYQPIILKNRPYSQEGHSAIRWVTLSSGIPFEGSTVISTPTLTPSPVSQQTPTPTVKATTVMTPTTAPTATTANPTVVASQPTSSCLRPYSQTSPWNTKISANPALEANNKAHIDTLTGTFGSDPTQYTYPVYEVTSATPLKTVTFSGVYSNVINDTTIDKTLKTAQINIPENALQSEGTDGQIIIWNKTTGDEWGLWQAQKQSNGTWAAKNGYHYNTNWDGVPPTLPDKEWFGSRGAGVTYLAGLIRPCEIAQGRIDHAIAFAYQTPLPSFVYPATKSDGDGSGNNLPEGARLQLDPALTQAQLQSMGCTGSCLIIAKAMQDYGMIVIDVAGHPKIYAEDDKTAHWQGKITDKTPNKIPLSSMRLLKYPTTPKQY